jgi:hypothetical protein
MRIYWLAGLPVRLQAAALGRVQFQVARQPLEVSCEGEATGQGGVLVLAGLQPVPEADVQTVWSVGHLGLRALNARLGRQPRLQHPAVTHHQPVSPSLTMGRRVQRVTRDWMKAGPPSARIGG